VSGQAWLEARSAASGYGIRRFVTATDSVAAPRSKLEPETLRASTRTVLVRAIIPDLERRRLIDLLPDRDAGTLASWLKQHEGEVAL
jgi:transposase